MDADLLKKLRLAREILDRQPVGRPEWIYVPGYGPRRLDDREPETVEYLRQLFPDA